VLGILNAILLDLSINVGTNTYNIALTIGEKAAVIIAQDLEIQGVTESD
jgi:alcohol oxidase